MSSRFNSSRGYSLAEILVVVAIVGALSLISVPAFINYQKSAAFKVALRTFTQDVRNARALAIANSYDVRMEFVTGTPNKSYQVFASRVKNTWFNVTLPGAVGNRKSLEGPVYLESTTFTDCTATTYPSPCPANGFPDIVFHPNGTVTIPAGQPVGEVRIRTDANILYNQWIIEFSPSGQLKTRGAKV